MRAKQGLLLVIVIMACAIASVEGVCSAQGCNTCIFNLDTASSSFAQSCTVCAVGYKLNTQAGCDLDIGMILGVSFGSFAIIIGQILCFCICGYYFKVKHRKPVQYTLDQIFKDLQEQQNDPETVKELQNKFKRFLQPQHDRPQQDCLYCRNYPQDKLHFKEYEKWERQMNKRKEKRLQNPLIQSNGEIQPEIEQEYKEKNPKGPTIFLEDCKHYYHLPCLQKQFNLTGRCNCKHEQAQTRLQIICKMCKLRQRHLTLKSSDMRTKGIKELNDYVCAVCYKKIYDELERLKWITKLL